MFEFVRTHRRLMQFLLLLFIFPSFAFIGVDSYSRYTKRSDAIAKVAGEDVTQQDWEAAKRMQEERFRQIFGAQYDPKLFDTPEARQGILDNLIADRVLAHEASRSRMTVPDQVLQQTILGIPGLTGADGKFDNARYRELLGVQGLTPTIYEARLRQDLATQQLNAAIQSTAFAPQALATMLSDLNDQERTVQELFFKNADYFAAASVSDELLKAYYQKNSDQFKIPAQVKAEYVMLNSSVIASKIDVSDADIKAYYEQNKNRYTQQEQRRASHILIAVAENATDAQKAAAKAKAESLRAQLEKAPDNFAALAKQHSQDPGSAESGGDLGFFDRSAMVKPFADAAFALEKGGISSVVKSDFGFHIIKLAEIKPGGVKPLDEVKDRIAADIRQQKASKQYVELAESFNNMVYEQADSLKPVAEKLNLAIQTTPSLTLEPNPELPPTALYNNPKFLKAIFSDEAVKNKHNTEAIEVSPNTLLAGRVVDYKPASVQPFEQVKADIRQRLVQEKAAELAKKAAEEKLAALKKNDSAAGFGAPKTVSRAQSQALPPEAFDAVMKADVKTLPTYQIAGSGQGYGIYRITKVAQGAAPDAARRQTEQQQLANALGQQETAAYINYLKQKADVEILKPMEIDASIDKQKADLVGRPK